MNDIVMLRDKNGTNRLYYIEALETFVSNEIEGTNFQNIRFEANGIIVLTCCPFNERKTSSKTRYTFKASPL